MTQKSPAEFFADNRQARLGISRVRSCGVCRRSRRCCARAALPDTPPVTHRPPAQPPPKLALSNDPSLSPRNIAGFDSPGKSLYTTIRELVENSLDAAEAAGALPDIRVTVQEITDAELNRLRGITSTSRRDATVYKDQETAAETKKRAAREARDRRKVEDVRAKAGDAAAEKEERRLDKDRRLGAAGASGRQFYRVTVEDNGVGMNHSDVPDMLGRVLSGTKYGVRQTRGKFGLGAKMALIWSKMSTGLPFEIRTCRGTGPDGSGAGGDRVSRFTLDIDIHRNEPRVLAESREPQLDPARPWRGAEISIVIEGAWSAYRARVLSYLRQIAVITPYAAFRLRYLPPASDSNADDAAGDGADHPSNPSSSAAASDPSPHRLPLPILPRGGLELVHARRTDAVPTPAAEARHHPGAVDLETLARLVGRTRRRTLAAFLCGDFDCVSPDLAERLCGELKGGLRGDTRPDALTTPQIQRLHHLLHEARFPPPGGGHLSPAGEYNLRLGVLKELRPDLIATHAAAPGAHEGHAFSVEAAVSLGSREIAPGSIKVFRFANRIPLLFEGGSDVCSQTALKLIRWQDYKINPATERIGVFVSVVSTKIPFKGAGKEYISNDVKPLCDSVRNALLACCLQLKTKLAAAQAQRARRDRKRQLLKLVPDAAAALWGILEAAAADRDAKRKAVVGGVDGANPAATLVLDVDPPDVARMMADVEAGRVTEETLQERLAQHVERTDVDDEHAFMVAQGAQAQGAVKDLWLAPRGAGHSYEGAVRGATCVVRLLKGCEEEPGTP